MTSRYTALPNGRGRLVILPELPDELDEFLACFPKIAHHTVYSWGTSPAGMGEVLTIETGEPEAAAAPVNHDADALTAKQLENLSIEELRVLAVRRDLAARFDAKTRRPDLVALLLAPKA